MPGWERERRFYFDPPWNPGRQVLIHPCPNSTFRIDWQVPPEYDLASEEASGALDTRIRKVIGDGDYESSGGRSTASPPAWSTGCASAACSSPGTRRTWCRRSGRAG